MLKLGLTGGIASGKSTVAAMLLGMGFAVLDADSLAHKIVEPGQVAYDEVVRAFGSDVTSGGGRIDRARLGALVFADPEKLNRLNAIVHPRVHEAMIRQLQDWERDGTHDAVFVEAALLVEANFVKDLDGLVVVWCSPEQQLERLLARGLGEEEARRRIAAQLAVADKLQQATHTIDCSGTVEQTRRQVEALVDNIRHTAGKRKA